MNSKAEKSFFEKYEFIVPLALFILFLIFTLPGISWGAPDVWHPDEIVVRSIKALHGEWQFSEINFDYPDLPQYAMLWLGKIILALGQTNKEVLIASRVLSAVLAGLTVVLTYIITCRISGNMYIAGLSGLLLICVSEMSHNGRFAHNDTYITFFTVLTVLFLVYYKTTDQRGWLYVSFLMVGMAASSKYNGIALVIAPTLIFITSQKHSLFKLSTLETFFISGALTVAGFVIGTPKSLTSMSFYFKHMIPALLHTGNYLRQPDSVRGIIGQYAVLTDGMGLPLFVLFMLGFVWVVYHIVQLKLNNKQESKTNLLILPVLAILALDLPIVLSFNYQVRFFLPMMPLLAIIAAFFVEYLYSYGKQRNVWFVRSLNIVLTVIIIYSFARNISVILLFMNDARFAASAYIDTLPKGTSLEHTLYPPSILDKHFRREHNYPIYFVKVPGDLIPTSKNYVFNVGEVGLDERQTDYLVTDSFTYDRFSDPYICANTQIECDFFKQLGTGQSNHYKLIAEFSYTLPVYLPQIEIAFVNPSIRIYQRIP